MRLMDKGEDREELGAAAAVVGNRPSSSATHWSSHWRKELTTCRTASGGGAGELSDG